jgi:membrane-bound lytic murein transglycosylase B
MSARTPAPPKSPREWIAYRIASAKAVKLGHVQAVDHEAAVRAAAADYGVSVSRIIVQPIGAH